jgi:hypothetical protein
MARATQVAPAARPGLVTAGGLLVAVALLQIAQQAIGAFSPRPSIKVAIVIGVGLAALNVESRTARAPAQAACGGGPAGERAPRDRGAPYRRTVAGRGRAAPDAGAAVRELRGLGERVLRRRPDAAKVSRG